MKTVSEVIQFVEAIRTVILVQLSLYIQLFCSSNSLLKELTQTADTALSLNCSPCYLSPFFGLFYIFSSSSFFLFTYYWFSIQAVYQFSLSTCNLPHVPLNGLHAFYHCSWHIFLLSALDFPCCLNHSFRWQKCISFVILLLTFETYHFLFEVYKLLIISLEASFSFIIVSFPLQYGVVTNLISFPSIKTF